MADQHADRKDEMEVDPPPASAPNNLRPQMGPQVLIGSASPVSLSAAPSLVGLLDQAIAMLSSSAASDISSPEVMRQLAATITASLTSSSSAPSSSSAQAVVSTPQTPARPPAPVATPVPHTTPTQPAAQAPPAMQPVAATQAPGPVAGGPTGMPVASVVERPVPTPVLPLPALAAGGAPSSSPLQSAVPVPMQLIQNMPTPLPQPQLAAAAATQPMDPSLVYRNRTVVDLKALLRSRGLRQTGLKADLVRRLVEDDAKRGKGPNAQPTSTSATPTPTAQSVPPIDVINATVPSRTSTAIPHPPVPITQSQTQPSMPMIATTPTATLPYHPDSSALISATPSHPEGTAAPTSSHPDDVVEIVAVKNEVANMQRKRALDVTTSVVSTSTIDLTSIDDDDDDEVQLICTTTANKPIIQPQSTSASCLTTIDVTGLDEENNCRKRQRLDADAGNESVQINHLLRALGSPEAVAAFLNRYAANDGSATPLASSQPSQSPFLTSMFPQRSTVRRGRSRLLLSEEDEEEETDILNGANGAPTEGPDTRTAYEKMQLYVNSPMNADITEELPEPPHLAVRLLPHQRQALWWLNGQEKRPMHKGGILADAMGVGKTIEMLSLILHTLEERNKLKEDRQSRRLPQGGTLVVCPLSTLSQWDQEVRDKVDEDVLAVTEFYGANRKGFTAAQLAQYDIVLTTYGTMQRSWPGDDPNPLVQRTVGVLHQVNWFRVVLDEGHIIRNESTQTSRAANELKAEYRWIMSGTPIQNSLDDMYSLLRFLKVPECQDKTWWKQNVDPSGDYSALKKLLETLLLRRPKDFVIAGKPIVDLPPLTISEVKLDLSEGHRAVYDYLFKTSAERFAQYYREGSVMEHYLDILSLLLRLRQICDQPMLVALSKLEQEKYMETLRRRGRPGRRKKYKFTYYEAGVRLREAYPQTLFHDGVPVRRMTPEGEAILNRLMGVTGCCCICLDEIEPGERLETSCRHTFCQSCFDDWRSESESTRCPECGHAAYPLRRGEDSRVTDLASSDPYPQVAKQNGRQCHLKKEPKKRYKRANSEDEGDEKEDGLERRALFKELGLSEDEESTPSLSSSQRKPRITSNDDDLLADLGITNTIVAPKVEEKFKQEDEEATQVKKEKKEEDEEEQEVKEEGEPNGDIKAEKVEIRDDNEERADQDDEEQEAPPRREWDLDEEERKAEEEITMLMESVKIKTLIDELERTLREEPGVKSLVYSQFTRYLDMVAHILRWKDISFVRLDGAMAKTKRQKAMQRFKDDPEVTIFLISLKAGGYGLNLTSASRVHMLDPWWNPASEQQAIDRAHRLGQTREVRVTRYLITNSIEERIIELQLRKNELARGAFEGGNMQRLGLKELRMLFGHLGASFIPQRDDPQQDGQFPQGPLGASWI